MTTSASTTHRPPIKCEPCRLNYNGSRYRILTDGSIVGALTEQQAKDLNLGSVREILDYEARELKMYEPHSPEARTIRREASRLRRNRNARERTKAMKDLGLKRANGGAFGGWE